MGGIFLRSWNWCKRIRHRRGYGVHSPSDFFLITFVIYEQMPFYAYSPLHHLRRVVNHLPHYREKVDKLLFRLTNYLQPSLIIEAGTGSGISTRYMAEACSKAEVCSFSENKEDAVERILSTRPTIIYDSGNILEKIRQLTKEGRTPDIVHIAHTPNYKVIFELLLPFAGKITCFIIGQPYENEEKKHWWKEIVSDKRTGVTFDLYDIGLVFFDKERTKEHRIINFL